MLWHSDMGHREPGWNQHASLEVPWLGRRNQHAVAPADGARVEV